jgi:hypothetical protein
MTGFAIVRRLSHIKDLIVQTSLKGRIGAKRLFRHLTNTTNAALRARRAFVS